jgi:hypothetical protein
MREVPADGTPKVEIPSQTTESQAEQVRRHVRMMLRSLVRHLAPKRAD